MGKFKCTSDESTELFCKNIADYMVKLFAISEDEAVGRINEEWANEKIRKSSLVFHRDAAYWAKRIYYENDTYWWVEEWMKENTPKPKPYPKRWWSRFIVRVFGKPLVE